MAKEWILNLATNRWGLNKKDIVGPVSLWIRECSPKDINEWRNYYYMKLQDFLKEKGITVSPQEYLKFLGEKLYIKITEVIRAEIDDVTLEDCIKYIESLVIDRTYEGYKTEIVTVYDLLERELNYKIKPAPDEWDRNYNVDFFIEINNKFIGIQIKPITFEQTPEIHKWKEILSKGHERFERDFGGKVFTIFSIKENKMKKIFNHEVIEHIKREIERLKNL